MSASHITGLADIVRQTRGVLADLPAIADEMKSTAAEVMANVTTVKALTGELKSANVELKAAIGQMANGGPPLETTETLKPVIPPPSIEVAPIPAPVQVAPPPIQPVNYNDQGNVEHLQLTSTELKSATL